MASLPSFQFYPADWRNDLALRACSPAARGVWMDIICLLHTADEYGVFRLKLSALATACGSPVKLLKELAAANVLKGSDSGLSEPYVFRPRHARKFGEPVVLIEATNAPVWFSARLVVDEYKRSKTGEGTRFSATNQPKAGRSAPPRRDGERQGDGSSSLSSSLSSFSKIHTTTAMERGPSLTGIELDQNQQVASDLIFAAASEKMRPVGPAGENWVAPLRMAESISAAVDSMLKSGPAVIDGSIREPWEFAAEIVAELNRSSPPAGLNPLCKFIESIWSRCQRCQCKPGDPHKSTPLKIEKPNRNGIDPIALAAKMDKIGEEADRINKERYRR